MPPGWAGFHASALAMASVSHPLSSSGNPFDLFDPGPSDPFSFSHRSSGAPSISSAIAEAQAHASSRQARMTLEEAHNIMARSEGMATQVYTDRSSQFAQIQAAVARSAAQQVILEATTSHGGFSNTRSIGIDPSPEGGDMACNCASGPSIPSGSSSSTSSKSYRLPHSHQSIPSMNNSMNALVISETSLPITQAFSSPPEPS